MFKKNDIIIGNVSFFEKKTTQLLETHYIWKISAQVNKKTNQRRGSQAIDQSDSRTSLRGFVFVDLGKHFLQKICKKNSKNITFLPSTLTMGVTTLE